MTKAQPTSRQPIPERNETCTVQEKSRRSTRVQCILDGSSVCITWHDTSADTQFIGRIDLAIGQRISRIFLSQSVPERNLRAAIPLQRTHVLMRPLRKWT